MMNNFTSNVCPVDPNVKPGISKDWVRDIIERNYGLQVLDIQQEVGYDTKNFRLTVDKTWENPYIQALCSSGYLFKVTEYSSSLREHLEAEKDVQNLLAEKGIRCPSLVLTKKGCANSMECVFSHEPSPTPTQTNGALSSRYMVRLQTFIPGIMFDRVKHTTSLVVSAGRYLARIHTSLQGCTDVKPLSAAFWNMENFPGLGRLIHYVRKPERHAIIRDVLREFSSAVVPKYQHFTSGIVHGDFNICNIIVQEINNNIDNNNEPNHEVCAVIDFEDMCRTYHVFDVAIAMMYMSLDTTGLDPLAAAGYFLAGYLSERTLNPEEFAVLKPCMAARYATSLVMGEYGYSKEPDNEYLLLSAKNGWASLQTLWETPQETLYEQWRTIIRGHHELRD